MSLMSFVTACSAKPAAVSGQVQATITRDFKVGPAAEVLKCELCVINLIMISLKESRFKGVS